MANERRSILVALGMGLLAGLLATLGLVLFSSSMVVAADESTTDLLPGVDLVTEEVEPGVYRVLGDAAGHDLVAEPPAGVTVAPDGSVWLMRADQEREVDAALELGQAATYPFDPSMPTMHDWADLAVDVDGVAWIGVGPEEQDGRWGRNSPQGSLSSIDDGTWAVPTWPDGSADVGAIETTADGTVWVARNVEDGAGPSVARIKDGEWTVLPTIDDPLFDGKWRSPHAGFVAAADGTAWLANGSHGLFFFDGQRWEVVDLPIDGRGLHTGPLALGPDGTLWVYASGDAGSGGTFNYLARLDADGWTVFSGRTVDAGGTRTLDEADGVPLLRPQVYYEARMAADPDGRLWIAVGGDGGVADEEPNWLYPPSLDPAPGPIGLLTFDGTTWNQYLRGLHVNRVDVADDGTIFATVLYGCPAATCDPYDGSGDWSLGGLYVITPEAVAASA